MEAINGDEVKNLVMFPSAKNFPMKEMLSDPLYDLINEIAPYYPDHQDSRFESEAEDAEGEDNETYYPSLEAFMNRHIREMSLTPDDKLIMKINQQMAAIQGLKDRIKFYMDEIEMYLPRKH